MIHRCKKSIPIWEWIFYFTKYLYSTTKPMNWKIQIVCGLLLLFTLCFACGIEEQKTGNETADFQVLVDGLMLYDRADFNGDILHVLQKGDQLSDLKEISPFLSKLQLKGEQFYLPWIKVKTKDLQEGWIFPCPLQLRKREGKMDLFLMEKQLELMLGNVLDSLELYREQLNAVQSLNDFKALYRLGQQIRSQWVDSLAQEQWQEEKLDLFWMKNGFPGYVLQLIGGGNRYYWFTNYNYYETIAAQTPSLQDDAFVALQLNLFPLDGIEYFYPSWFLQTQDYGGHSLLGRGLHLQILTSIDSILNVDLSFQSELQLLKSKLLDDITEEEVTYWETKAKIIEELETILNHELDLLTQEDRIMLSARLLQFKKSEEFSIRLNYRSGNYVN